MKKHLLILTCLFALSTFALAGCGQSDNSTSPDGTTDSPARSEARLTMEEARRTALARVPGATENDIRIHLEMDDRIQVYDGEIVYNQREYDFEIDAGTGEILEWSEDTVNSFD